MSEEMELMPRTITLRLSDNRCDDILKLCGKCGLTVSELIESFLEDLTADSYRDESCIAESWLRRRNFDLASEGTLLRFLYEEDIEAEYFIQLYYDIEDTNNTLKRMRLLREPLEELKRMEIALEECEEEFLDYKTRYLKENPEADWEKEIKQVKEWDCMVCNLRYAVNLQADVEESEEGFL